MRIWNNSVQGKSQLLKAHNAPIKSIDFSSDGKFIITGSNDQYIKLFSISERKFKANYLGHNNWVKSVRFSPDVRLIVSGSEDNTVKIWDVNKYCVVNTYIDHLQPVNAVRWSPDGTCVASCSNDKKIKVFDIRSGRIIQHYDAHSAPITSLSYHPSGKYLVSSSLDSYIKIWDIFNSKILYTVHGHQGPVNSVDFSREGDYICSGGADATLMVWKNNLSGAGYPAKSKYPENEGLSRPVTFMKKSNKIKKKVGTSNSTNLNKNSNSDDKVSNKVKNSKSNYSSKNSNMKSNGTGVNMINNVNNSVPLKSNAFRLNESSSHNYELPQEMKITFEKMISQLDLVSKTIKIFDQRLQNLEGHITTLANRQKKGFVKRQPPQMGDYQYLIESSGSNYLPNSSIRNQEEYQKYTNLNNMDYYTAEISNQGSTFKEAMNINEESKKNMYKTDIEMNKMNNDNQNIKDGNGNEYMGEIHEEYGYNIGDNPIDQEGNNGQNEEEQYEEGQYEEQNNEQQGEEYEEEMQEEQYNYEEQYEEGNYEDEEQMEEYQGEEEEIQYDYNNDNNNEEMNEDNNEQENPK